VTVRYSNSTGVPTIPDNDPARSGPRESHPLPPRRPRPHRHHRSFDQRLPVRTGEEFVQFLRAVAAAGAGSPRRSPRSRGHPNAKRFVETAKPIRPASPGRRSSPSRRSSSRTRRREPSRAVSDPARSRDRVSLQRRRSGEVRDLPLRRARPEARQGAGPVGVSVQMRSPGGRRRCQCGRYLRRCSHLHSCGLSRSNCALSSQSISSCFVFHSLHVVQGSRLLRSNFSREMGVNERNPKFLVLDQHPAV